jgi:Ca2+-binding EF-hand superfamily protein
MFFQDNSLTSINDLKMLSLETEKRIARLFFQTAECERSVERSRSDLCSNINFDAYSTFRILDVRTNGRLTAQDLSSFLASKGISVINSSITLLIKQYDSNFDGCLGLEEFQSLVLPAEDLELRREVLARTVFPVSSYVENALARHLELECSYQAQLETLKRSLASRPDFSAIDCFRVVDVDRLSFLNVYEVRDFLRRNGYSITMQDLDSIIRRIDIDADGKLSYEEFSDWITPLKSPASPKKSKNSLRRSPSKASPSKSSSKSSSTKSPVRVSTSKSLQSSPVKSSKRNSKTLNKPIRSKLFEKVPPEDMQVVVHYLSEIIDIYNDLEKEKVDLARRLDFNLLDFFRVFDLEERNSIISHDFEAVLHDLRIPFHVDDVYLLIRHYSSYRDSVLRFSDIERMILPNDRHLAIVLKSRVGRSIAAYDRLQVFGVSTLDQIIRVLKLLLISENAFENLRRCLDRKKWINLFEVFQDIDQDQDSLISIAEFQDILKMFKVYPSVDELERLVFHFDRDFDRKVSYSEFVEELTPKLYN